MKKILLHVCCGVCAGWPVTKLREEGFEPVCYFFNPNIGPVEEYERRLGAARVACAAHKCELIEGAYDHDGWLARVSGMEEMPEGGSRCAVCFRLRLAGARDKAKEETGGLFTTTLTVSSHKNAELINAIGTSLSLDGFLRMDFKKEDGFKKTSQFARDHNLYRQHYCGCPFSKNKL